MPHSRPVPPIRSCSLCFSRSSLPCLGRPMRAQSRPPRHLRARATSRRRKRAANPPRAPTRSTLSAGVRPCGRRRERGGATVGVYVRFSQVWSAAAIIAGVMPSSSAAAAAARWQRWQQRRQPWGLSRRRDPARVGASQCYACRQRAAAGREAAGAVCREGQRMCGGRAGAMRSCARCFAHVEAWVVHVRYAAHPAGM